MKKHFKKVRKETALLRAYKYLTAGTDYCYETTLRIIRKHLKN